MIQVFGTAKCKDTQKAIRFFKERTVKIQFIDLSQKAVSKGELDSILLTVKLDDLLNKNSKEYERLNLQYMVHDVREQLLEHPLLLTTPIVRFKTKAVVGLKPEVWNEWATESKKKQ